MLKISGSDFDSVLFLKFVAEKHLPGFF